MNASSTNGVRDVFWLIPEPEVARLQRKAAQAQRMRDYVNECANRALSLITGSSAAPKELGLTTETAEMELGLAVFQAVVDCEQKLGLPVPAYIAPVKRWAGGPSLTTDNWYWDYNSF